MKIEFTSHDEHQAFLDSGTAITDAFDANDIEVEDVRCTDKNCPGDEKDDDEDDGDERSAYRKNADGSLEVRERRS